MRIPSQERILRAAAIGRENLNYQVQQWGHGVMDSELPGTRYQASFTDKYSTPRTDDLYDLFPLQFMT